MKLSRPRGYIVERIRGFKYRSIIRIKKESFMKKTRRIIFIFLFLGGILSAPAFSQTIVANFLFDAGYLGGSMTYKGETFSVSGMGLNGGAMLSILSRIKKTSNYWGVGAGVFFAGDNPMGSSSPNVTDAIFTSLKVPVMVNWYDFGNEWFAFLGCGGFVNFIPGGDIGIVAGTPPSTYYSTYYYPADSFSTHFGIRLESGLGLMASRFGGFGMTLWAEFDLSSYLAAEAGNSWFWRIGTGFSAPLVL
jgi:hypothetical protein